MRVRAGLVDAAEAHQVVPPVPDQAVTTSRGRRLSCRFNLDKVPGHWVQFVQVVVELLALPAEHVHHVSVHGCHGVPSPCRRRGLGRGSRPGAGLGVQAIQ